jgi:hypothetical protein
MRPYFTHALPAVLMLAAALLTVNTARGHAVVEKQPVVQVERDSPEMQQLASRLNDIEPGNALPVGTP